jgi:glycosyltransferase involved in cell wall biosynthesis
VNILLTSHRFFPEIGGTEIVAELLAEEFSQAGHQTIVVTQTTEGTGDPGSGYRREASQPAKRRIFPYLVVRRPSLRELLQLYCWCDVVLQNQVGLRTAWPLIFVHRPWVISHHMWLHAGTGVRGRFKLRLLRFARNVAASQALVDRLPIPARVIPNPYQRDVFKEPEKPFSKKRQKDLIFVGRLIRGKGVHVLIEALRELERRGSPRELTVVGEGPALPELRDLAMGLSVNFVGSRRGNELGELMATHRFLIVPSIEPEAFGNVAIEGLACGCVVVACRNAGLVEAVGPHGVFCEPDDPKSLADAILRANGASRLLSGVSQHLSRHDPRSVAHEYLKVLSEAVASNGHHSQRRAPGNGQINKTV